MYLFTNLLGSFIIENQIIKDQIIFPTLAEYQHKESAEKKLKKKYPQAISPPPDQLPLILQLFREKKYFSDFSQKNLQLTTAAIQNSVTEDQLIIQTIANVDDLNKVINLLSKRLREWYSWYFPELSKATPDNEMFAVLTRKKKTDLINELGLSNDMGAELSSQHIQEMQLLADEITTVYTLRRNHEQYLQQVLKEYCPNLLELAGVIIAARLIELGKSLKHLALLPSSTIQLLGAEKALFRHLKTGAKSPKYGVILAHPLVQKAQHRGKAARMLADKLSLCARLDYFKGEFKAPHYLQELEAKIT